MNGFCMSGMPPLVRRVVSAAGAIAIAASALAGAATAHARAEAPSVNWTDDGARLRSVGQRLALANRARCEGTGAEAAAKPRCASFTIDAGPELNAWADGQRVVVTSKMMRAARSDDMLAFVVAHEMAHNILAHAEKLKGINANFIDADAAMRVRSTEIEADALAIELVAKAGFDPGESEIFLHKVMKQRKMKMPGTHPGVAQRIGVVRSAISKLKVQADNSDEN